MLSPLLRYAALFGFLWMVASIPVRAADPVWPAWRTELIDKLAGQVQELRGKLEKDPNELSTLSRLGDVYLFLGAFPEAVAQFEKMIEVDSNQDAGNWRLGIAYYFNGQYDKSARQFEKYHAYDGRDRENGIWKFLAQEKVDGIAKARAEMLTYEQFDREPFPALYEMYAGKRTPDEVFAEIEKKELSKNVEVMFYANYYVGLYELMSGNRPKALALLGKAVEIKPRPDTVYMWNVARLHWERLVRLAGKGWQ